MRTMRFRRLIVLTAVLFLSLTSTLAQDSSKKPKKTYEGTPVLWRDPGDVSTLDLFKGPGGDEMKPDISNLTFIREETGGYSMKYRVRDGAGKIWVVKLGKESRPETASARLTWAAGFMTEIHYLYPCVQIKGATAPKKSVDRCEGKGFANARFEARPEHIKRLEEWTWANNPFVGKDELKGLIVLMGLLNNWDLKDANNKILFVPGDGGQNELRYIISDLGATFGKTGGFISRSRNEPEDYAKSKFIEGVEGGKVKFAYSGKNSALFSDITVAQAKWIGDLLSRLSDQQLGDAFRAANFNAEEVAILVPAVRGKIAQLVNLGGTPTARR